MEHYREAMGRALFYANRARETGDVPVGAVVLDSVGNIVGRGWNCREERHDPAGHAEIVALRDAGRRLGRWNLAGCTLVVTLEPCTMCAGAIIHSRVDRVVFGAWDEKAGAAGSIRDVLRDSRMNHTVEVIAGVLEQEASVQLRAFFESRRGVHGRDEGGSASLAAQNPPPRLRPLAEAQVVGHGGVVDEPALVAPPPSPVPAPRPAPSTRSASEAAPMSSALPADSDLRRRPSVEGLVGVMVRGRKRQGPKH
ncbi:tRNA adenosine(34) deaminase TadA [Schaalia sp. 19OD2882]|uniref:tRNA adenosine(34) deaminase TadA n=1 Tax=Schaalia sp. 19OD2882 TaxID=2794089 RepID=UPI0020A7BB7A|nr:tRNA adenosine(34) deaminase TadA [Schaalia sp. 19OD2882]